MTRTAFWVAFCMLFSVRIAAASNVTVMDANIRVATANIYSIGIEWDLTGDDNHNAKCSARYRVAGSSTWKNTIGLLRVDYQGWYGDHTDLAYKHFNMFAGSIMFLTPGTAYEVELDVTDPDGGNVSKTITLTTRTEPVLTPVRTLQVVPGSGGGSGTAADPYRGLAAAAASAQPGDLFLLHAGNYPGYIWTQSGAAGKYIALKAAGDGNAVMQGELGVNCNFLWIEGLTFDSTAADGTGGVRGEVSYGTGPSDIVVVRNTFKTVRYALSNVDQSWDGNQPQLYRRWYIADNVNLGGPKNEYFMRFYVLADSDVCYNQISTTLNGLGGDGISLRFGTNDDVYNNDMRETDDDAFEPDSAYANIRIWHNRAISPRNQGVSCQPMFCSPWYIVGNEFILDCQDRHATIFKTNVFDRMVVVNNTFIVRGRYAQVHADIVMRSFSRNNLWYLLYDNADEATNPGGTMWYGFGDDVPDQTSQIHGQSQPNWETDADYDGFGMESLETASTPDLIWYDGTFNDLPSFSAAKHIEQHAKRVVRLAIFANPDVLTYARTPFSTQRLDLKPGSNAVDAGQMVPNLAEDFSGSAPDLGATELGKPATHYGPRTSSTPPPPTKPSIVTQPANVTVTVGQAAKFTVSATGSAPLIYQWQKGTTNISGATNASYTTPATTSADNGATYRCVVSNAAGSATSNSAKLTVNPVNTPPTLVSPASATPNAALTGESVSFSVAAADNDGDNVWYTWNFGDGAVSATSASGGAFHSYASTGTFTATVTISDGHGHALASSISVTVSAPLSLRIDSGSRSAVGAFAADTSFSGGTTYSTTHAITTTGVVNPAPVAVYQTERYGNFTYTLNNLVPGGAYTVRLHFAEIYWSSAGKRLFNVAINGQQVLANFDIFAAAGGNFIALVREFPATAANGQIVITYSTLKDNAKSSGIEVIPVPASSVQADAANAAANIAPNTSVAAIDLGSFRANTGLNIALERPETGGLAKKLRWVPAKGSKLPRGAHVSGGMLFGKIKEPGAFNFQLQMKTADKHVVVNNYALSITP